MSVKNITKVGKELAGSTFAELAMQFETEMAFDGRLLRSRTRRSLAYNELTRRGCLIFDDVAKHLEKTKPKPGSDIQMAWTILLSCIKADLQIGGGPIRINDPRGWA